MANMASAFPKKHVSENDKITARKEVETALRVRAAKTAKLRALRLEKEAEEKKAAELAPKKPPKKRAPVSSVVIRPY